MTATEYYETYNDLFHTGDGTTNKNNITMDKSGAIEFAESYHQAKSKEEAEERYELAVDYINRGAKFEYKYSTEEAIRLAAFGKEEK